ncbi:RING-box protein 1a [Trifolium repens]|nr:RING-box protein 1a [Trifolium repens]
MAKERVEYLVTSLDSSYNQQTVKPHTMSDFFKIKVNVVHRDFTTIPGTMIPTCVFRTSISINCNEFFTQNQDFLWLYLQGFYLASYFNYEDLALITRSLIPRVKKMFGFSDSFRHAKPNAGERSKDIPLVLNIISNVQQEEPRNCCICMERLHDDLEKDGDSDEVKVSTTVCGHIFHYNCIVKWLRTSPVCPLNLSSCHYKNFCITSQSYPRP